MTESELLSLSQAGKALQEGQWNRKTSSYASRSWSVLRKKRRRSNDFDAGRMTRLPLKRGGGTMTLKRGLEHLEATAPRRDQLAQTRSRFVSQQVIDRMTESELLSLSQAGKALQEGRSLTPEESATCDAYDAALEKECQKLGYKSLAQFGRGCGVSLGVRAPRRKAEMGVGT
jgi:hypothetical protein